jgi:hypothetical protein
VLQRWQVWKTDYNSSQRGEKELAMAQPDYRHTTTNIDVQFDPHGIRAWLSCVLDDGKMLLLATDRVTHQEICRQIQQQLNR